MAVQLPSENPNADPTGIWRAIGLSLVFHALFLSLFSLFPSPETIPAGSGTESSPSKIVRVKFMEPNAKDSPGQVVDIMDSRPSEAKPNPNARFLSDKNRTVEHETQARLTGPNPNAPQGSNPGRPEEVLKKLSPFGVQALQKESEGKVFLGLPETFLKGPQGLPNVASVAPSNYLPEISLGDETLLNTREYAYATFFVRMKRQMEGVWNPRPILFQLTKHRDQYVTTVSITLRENGYLESTSILQSSGNNELDREAIVAVQKGAPYLNPPIGLSDPDGKIRIPNWHFIVTLGSMF